MLQSLGLTNTFAVLLGLYFLAAGAGLLRGRADMKPMMDDLLARPLLAYFGGLIAFVIGAVIVALHNRWDGALEIIVSLVGWLALAEGVLMLAAREQFLSLVARVPLTPRVVTGFGAITLAMGGLLMFAGLRT